jgi:hypothetical protein
MGEKRREEEGEEVVNLRGLNTGVIIENQVRIRRATLSRSANVFVAGNLARERLGRKAPQF